MPDDSARAGSLPGQATIPVILAASLLWTFSPHAIGRNFGDGTAEFIGTTARISNGDFFTIKVDHLLSSSDSISVRYLFDDSDQTLPRNFPNFRILP